MDMIAVVVSGSLRKHLGAVQSVTQEFTELGVAVFSPRIGKPVNPGDDFVVLDTDETDDPKAIEHRHLEAIRQGRALYVVDPGGYIGLTVAMEIGFAYALGKKIFVAESPQDFAVRLFAHERATVAEVHQWLCSPASSP